MKLPPVVSQMLLDFNGETAVSVQDGLLTSIVLKSKFEYNRYPGCVIAVSPMCANYDTGPVFRLYFEFRNQFTGDAIYSGDTFLNPVSLADRKLIRNLANQEELRFHFFNADDVDYVGSKAIRWNPATAKDIGKMLTDMLARLALIHPEKLDYAASLAAIQAETE